MYVHNLKLRYSRKSKILVLGQVLKAVSFGLETFLVITMKYAHISLLTRHSKICDSQCDAEIGSNW